MQILSNTNRLFILFSSVGKLKFFIFFLIIIRLNAIGQENANYLRANAVYIGDPEKLNDSVYKLLDPFQIIMLGEVHGINESAQFVKGLANLYTSKGDSVQVGLELPAELMKEFNTRHTDSSIYQSLFFSKPLFKSGRESFAWAGLISMLNKNPKVELFFFDINVKVDQPYQRDSLMYTKIKANILKHPKWKVVTLSGNFHNLANDQNSMANFLKQDKELNLSSRICTLNIEYQEGTCMANFGQGLELRRLGQEPRIYDTALNFDKYLVLVSPKSYYEYTGFYYTKYITAAKMVAKE